MPLHRRERLRLDRKPEPRRKPNARSMRSLSSVNRRSASPIVRTSPRARSSRPPTKSSTAASERLPHRVSPGIQQHPVDREVPPQHIFARLVRKHHRLRPASIQIRAIVAKRSHLRGHRSPSTCSMTRMTPKCAPTSTVCANRPEICVRPRVSRQVVVFGSLPQQEIAHASTRKIGLEPRLEERPRNCSRRLELRCRCEP